MEITRTVGLWRIAALFTLSLSTLVSSGDAGEGSQLGLTSRRNNVAPPAEAPAVWSDQKRVKWVRALGTDTNSSPVIAGGRIYLGTNNGSGFLTRYPQNVDMSVLLCLEESTGRLLWQYSSPKLPSGKVHDWPEMGICSAPLVEADRVYFVTNRGEVVCLDVEGFRDQENDGPVTDEEFSDLDDADVVWRLDMMGELGVEQHNMANCSVTAAGEILLVCTSNGINRAHQEVAVPEAPSFLGIDKTTGRVIWSDNSPGENILHGQWSSPATAKIGGVTQAIFAGGDGWVYSFDPGGNGRGDARLLWKFDCNSKLSRWGDSGHFERNNIIAMPVIFGDRVYVATGQGPDRGEGRGRLWCIHAAKRLDGSDVSDELAVASDGKPLAHRRVQAVDRAQGEQIIRNPATAGVWCYVGEDGNHDGKLSFDEQLHRTIASVAVHADLLIAVDTVGIVHCLDAKSGTAYWTYDVWAEVWASPLIVGDRVFIADTAGTVSIFRLAANPQRAMKLANGKRMPLIRWEFDKAIHSTPTVSERVLYIATQKNLHALELSQNNQSVGKKLPGHSAER